MVWTWLGELVPAVRFALGMAGGEVPWQLRWIQWSDHHVLAMSALTMIGLTLIAAVLVRSRIVRTSEVVLVELLIVFLIVSWHALVVWKFLAYPI